MKYNFVKLKNHYEKHVLGIDKEDGREKWDINRETAQWNRYKNVKSEKDYYLAANKNITDKPERKYVHITRKTLSINYQKRNVRFDSSMLNNDIKYEGLLTTCVVKQNNMEEKITSCFYKTKTEGIKELINMSLIILDNKLDKIDSHCGYIYGFNLNTFNDEFNDIINHFYEEHLVVPNTSYYLAKKRFIVDILKIKLEEYNDNFSSFLKEAINMWIKAYDNKKDVICLSNLDELEIKFSIVFKGSQRINIKKLSKLFSINLDEYTIDM